MGLLVGIEDVLGRSDTLFGRAAVLEGGIAAQHIPPMQANDAVVEPNRKHDTLPLQT